MGRREIFYKLVSRHEEKKVLYVVDPKAEGTFHGIPIRKELERKDEDSFIIVAADWNAYIEISKSLRMLGLREFINFIPTQVVEKKIAVVHANCLGGIRNLLPQISQFSDEFFVANTFYSIK